VALTCLNYKNTSQCLFLTSKQILETLFANSSHKNNTYSRGINQRHRVFALRSTKILLMPAFAGLEYYFAAPLPETTCLQQTLHGVYGVQGKAKHIF